MHQKGLKFFKMSTVVGGDITEVVGLVRDLV